MNSSYTDLLIRIRMGSEGDYPVEAWLSDGSFYQGLVNLTEKALIELRTLELAPLAYGHLLFKTLFQNPIDEALTVASSLAHDHSEGHLRIRLLLDSGLPPDVQALKWELMSQDQHLLALSIDPTTAFSRYTALPEPDPLPLDDPVIRLLVVVSAPSNSEKYGLAAFEPEREIGRLYDALKDVWNSGRCQATILCGDSSLSENLKDKLRGPECSLVECSATLENIGKCLTNHHVLHFLGHGTFRHGKGSLFLENEDRTGVWVKEADLVPKLRRDELRLVFLAACESAKQDQGLPTQRATKPDSFTGLAARFVKKGIPAVVAMQDVVSPDAAFRLAGEFYRQLFLRHGMVDRALNEARNLLYRDQQQDWTIPVLYMRLKTGQLATINPVWAALQAAREHHDYAMFRSEKYISLPVQAIKVGTDQNPEIIASFELTGAVDVGKAVLSRLDARASEGANDPIPAPIVLIVGGPGTNKSTQLQCVGWQTINNGLELSSENRLVPVENGRDFSSKNRLVPIFLDLKDYQAQTSATGQDLEARILAGLKPFWPDPLPQSLDKLPEYVRLRVLGDAGHSMLEDGRDLIVEIAGLAKSYPKHQFVLALPSGALDWKYLNDNDRFFETGACVDDLYALAIQPLTLRNIRHFLQAQNKVGRKLLEKLNDTQLLDLTGTPYFAIRLLQQAYKGRDPKSRVAFLNELVQKAIAAVPSSEGMRANAAETLFHLAWEMQQDLATTWRIEDALSVMDSTRGLRGYKPEDIYKALIQQETLMQVGEREVRFTYPCVQAYCCARAVLKMPDRDVVLSDIVSTLGSPLRLRWWEETMVVLCGFLASSAQPDDVLWLQRLLESLVYGTNLMDGELVFLAARCLLECRTLAQRQPLTLSELTDHVVNALRWRTDSANEPDVAMRLRANQLLAQLGMPKFALDLAKLAYAKIRKNEPDDLDFEFSSIRYAATTALRRMKPEDATEDLTAISPLLPDLFDTWQVSRTSDDEEKLRKAFAQLIKYSRTPDDLGIQGIAALALGDLHGKLHDHSGKTTDSALKRLVRMFRYPATRQSVRWVVADALSFLDVATVREKVITPALSDSDDDITKSLAYLIGLLRLRDGPEHDFLVRTCLQVDQGRPVHSWSTWSTAIVALGEIADPKDKELLAAIVKGHAPSDSPEPWSLNRLFEEKQCAYIRRRALKALANLGELSLLESADRIRIAGDTTPGLAKEYFQVVRDNYWRKPASMLSRSGASGKARPSLGKTTQPGN